jgi:hypothetical protein
MTRKQTAALASMGLFAAGFVGLCFLVGSIKDKFSETMVYAITMAVFGAVCGLGILTSASSTSRPTSPPLTQIQNEPLPFSN